MDGSVDIKLLLSLAAMLVSVVSASVIVKQKLAAVIEQLNAMQKDYESRLRSLDKRTDKQETEIGVSKQKTEILSSILSPSNLARQNRETERIIVIAENNQSRITKLESIHNGSHPKPT